VASDGISLSRGIIQEPNDFKERVGRMFFNQLEYFGRAGYLHRLEFSTNLVDWLPASGWISGEDQFLIWDIGAPQEPMKFWRGSRKLP
jgi:hypothetical protein